MGLSINELTEAIRQNIDENMEYLDKLIWYKLKNIGKIKNISISSFHKINKILPIINFAIKKSHR